MILWVQFQVGGGVGKVGDQFRLVSNSILFGKRET